MKGISLKTGTVISYQSAGDILRFNSHWHALVLEGGLDKENNFHYISLKDLSDMTELFRQKVIRLLVKKKLLNHQFARNLLSWKHSGFSINNSVLLRPHDDRARENLCQYIIRHPVSLKKIEYIPAKSKVLYHTKYNEYWKENIKLFTANDFIAELTQHLPPKRKHMIRYYGLYSSRSKGKARIDGTYEKFGINGAGQGSKNDTNFDTESVESNKSSNQTWARLIQKVYEVDPMKCPKCGGQMKIIAVITDSFECKKIVGHLKKNKSPPFDIDVA